MNTTGRHVLAEFHGCDAALLNDKEHIEALMKRAAEAAGATLVGTLFHRFTPQGVSGVVVVEESHLSIHTWPERGYAAADFYTCGECLPEKACEVLGEGLKMREAEIMVLDRGQGPAPTGIIFSRHETLRPRARNVLRMPRKRAAGARV